MADDYIWLTTENAQQHIAQVCDMLAVHQDELKIAKRLRQSMDAERCRLVISLALLRRKARSKFVLADQMYFTDIGLQQATGETIADYKAKRFDLAQPIWDLCSGIGGDAIRLARCEGLTCVDSDKRTLHFAMQNLQVYGVSGEFQDADVSEIEYPINAQIHIDPDRRNPNLKNSNQRTTRLEHYSPELGFLTNIIKNHPACIKLAPATEIPSDIEQGCEREWIGFAGECKQQLLWCGNVAKTMNAKTVTVIDKHGVAESLHRINRTLSVYTMTPSTPKVLRYVHQPHSAVFASGMLNELSESLEIPRLECQPRFLTSETVVESQLVSSFEVLGFSSTKTKRLNRDLNSLDAGEVEFKCKPPFDKLPQSRNRFDLIGDQRITIIPLRVREKTQVLLCKRL